jgi:hypothetical protein
MPEAGEEKHRLPGYVDDPDVRIKSSGLTVGFYLDLKKSK